MSPGDFPSGTVNEVDTMRCSPAAPGRNCGGVGTMILISSPAAAPSGTGNSRGAPQGSRMPIIWPGPTSAGTVHVFSRTWKPGGSFMSKPGGGEKPGGSGTCTLKSAPTASPSGICTSTTWPHGMAHFMIWPPA